ncbi:hypothetical protein R1flu_007762 [Riccia fluitans]|uniref:Uncharacterized protein n=1 Tax=Riccia fluitans TaxID=41844 RepID=A0ABD1Z001_9MARC
MAPHSSKGLKVKTKEKLAISKYEYRGKPGAWTSDVWREVYNLPKASPGGYVMKGKVQFIELQLLRLVKGDRQQSKFGIFLEQTISNSNTKTEDEKEPKEEIPYITLEGEASENKPLDKKMTVEYHEWGVRLESLGQETSKLFEAFHVEVGNVTAEAVVRNME